jgi:hypothetical protein
MVLLVEGTALEEFPHSVSSLFQNHCALKERSTRLVTEKSQVWEMFPFYICQIPHCIG